jgi:hypothetical protein
VVLGQFIEEVRDCNLLKLTSYRLFGRMV